MGRDKKKKMTGPKGRGFIGRRQIIREIYKAISKKEGAIVLKGPAGVGKSALAVRAVANLRRKGYEFIIIQGETNIEQILEAISKKAVDLGVERTIEVHESDTDPIKKLSWYLEQFLLQEKVVIIFDNFEENQDAAKGDFNRERLKRFLWYFRDCLKNKDTFLLFSTRYTLPGFESSGVIINIPEFSPVEFDKMLLNSNALKRLDGTSVKALREEVGGNPRALELLDKIALEEFNQDAFTWEQLKDLFPELQERILHKKEKEDNFTPLFLDKLLGYLSEIQRRLVDVFSIYRNPVPVEAIAVHNVSIEKYDYKKLEDLSLLECMDEDGVDLYYVHRLTAQYLLNQMEPDIRNSYHTRAAQYFEGIRTEEGKKYLENDVEARWHYVRAGAWNRAAEITFDLEYYLSLHGSPQWAMELLQELELEQLEEENKGIAHNRLGILHQDFGEYDKALKCFKKALEINENRDDKKGIAVNLHQIGMIHQYKGNYDDALRQYEQALEIKEKIGDTKGIATSLHQIGMIHHMKGHYDEALKQYEQSLEIAEKIRDSKGIAESLHQIGIIYEYKGHFDEALKQYEQSLEIKEKIGDTKGIAESLHQIGRIYEEKGHYDEALSRYEQALEINEKIGNIYGKALSLGQMGQLYFKLDKHDTSLRFSVNAFILYAKLGSPNLVHAKKDIARVRETLPGDQFHAILKEFNLEAEFFDKMEAEDQQQRFIEFLAGLTSEAVSASEKNSEEKEKMAAQLNEYIDKLQDDPEAVELKSYFQLLLVCVYGSDYQKELEKIPKELKELFEKIKKEKSNK